MAIELGMTDEVRDATWRTHTHTRVQGVDLGPCRRQAEALYRECGRYDLLVALQQAAGRWDAALATCEAHYRIHLKPLKLVAPHSHVACAALMRARRPRPA